MAEPTTVHPAGMDYVPHAAGFVANEGPKLLTSRFPYEDSYTLDRAPRHRRLCRPEVRTRPGSGRRAC